MNAMDGRLQPFRVRERVPGSDRRQPVVARPGPRFLGAEDELFGDGRRRAPPLDVIDPAPWLGRAGARAATG